MIYWLTHYGHNPGSMWALTYLHGDLARASAPRAQGEANPVLAAIRRPRVADLLAADEGLPRAAEAGALVLEAKHLVL